MRHYQVFLTLIATALILASYLMGWTPLILVLWLVLVSLISFALYASDKKAAQNGEWRVPENSLHFFDLLGGWPGGLLAQQQFRHKTRKVNFRIVFWLTVVLNSGFYLWLHTPHGHLRLRFVMLHVQQFVLNQGGSKTAISYVLSLTDIPTYETQ